MLPYELRRISLGTVGIALSLATGCGPTVSSSSDSMGGSSSGGPDSESDGDDSSGIPTSPNPDEGSGSTTQDPDTSTSNSEPVCGDGQVDDDEDCDDGNQADDDGCNASCEPSGLELWRTPLLDWDGGVPFSPLVTSDGEFLVPVDPNNFGSPTMLFRVDADGEYLGLVTPELTPDMFGDRGMEGLSLTDDDRLLYGALAEDGVSYRWVQSETDGSDVVETPLTWVGEQVGVAAAVRSPWGLVVLSARSADVPYTIAVADPDDLASPLSPIAEIENPAFASFVVEQDRVLMLGGDVRDGRAFPTVWELNAQGIVSVFQPESVDTDIWFRSAAFDEGTVLLSDNEDQLWQLTDELTPLEVRAERVAMAAGSGWWVAPTDEAAAQRIGPQLQLLYAVQSTEVTSPSTMIQAGPDLVAVEFRSGKPGVEDIQLHVARYAP